MENRFDVPVVLFVFRRLDTVKLIFEKLQELKPTKLYVFSDGARVGREDEEKKVQAVRKYVTTAVNWVCDFRTEYAEENKGCAANICEGINTVFSKEKCAIILEDDAVPMREYFLYCECLLRKYQYDKRIQYIAGFNAIGDTNVIEKSYAFSKSAPMSGAIATWAERWNNCDFSMKTWPMHKIKASFRHLYYKKELYNMHCKAFEDAYKGLNDGWDYQFHFDMFVNERYAIVPRGNLVCSYGYVEGAFHPQSQRETKNLKKIMNYTEKEFLFPMEHPDEIVLNKQYDRMRQELLIKVSGNYWQRHANYMYRKIKELTYRYMPQSVWLFFKKMVKK